MADARTEQQQQAKLQTAKREASRRTNRAATGVLATMLAGVPSPAPASAAEGAESHDTGALVGQQAFQAELLRQQAFARQWQEAQAEAAAAEAASSEAGQETAVAAKESDSAAATLIKKPGAAAIRQLWFWAIPTFGVTFLLIEIAFFLSIASPNLFRRFIPFPGEEWTILLARPGIPMEKARFYGKAIEYSEWIVLGVLNGLIMLALMNIFVLGAGAYAVISEPSRLFWAAIEYVFGF